MKELMAEPEQIIELFKWTVGGAATAISIIAATGLTALRWTARYLFSDEIDARSNQPRGVVTRIHVDALSKLDMMHATMQQSLPGMISGLGQITALQRDLSEIQTKVAVIDVLEDKIDKLMLHDEQHTSELREIRSMVQRLRESISNP